MRRTQGETDAVTNRKRGSPVGAQGVASTAARLGQAAVRNQWLKAGCRPRF